MRRSALHVNLMLVACTLHFAISAALADDPKPPLDDRPPQKTGFIPSLKFEGLPKMDWKFSPELDERGRQPGLSDAATSGGVLFFGDDFGVVRALTAREGVPIWTHAHGERVFFPPTCDGERLFFTTRKGITALESSSGIHMWHRPVRHSVGRCVAWQEANTVYFSDSDGWLYALDAEDGREKWKASFVEDAPEDPPGFDGERARFEGTAARPTGIATDGTSVFQSVFDQCRVVAHSCQTGERTATFQTQGWIFGDPAVDETRLYVGSQDKHLYCFDKSSGKVFWKLQTNSRIESGPGVTRDRVIVGSCDGSIHCCDKNSGRLLWKTPTDRPGAIYSAPIVTEDSVYFAAAEGTVYALALETGAIKWRYRPADESNFYSSPATDGTRIFIKGRSADDEAVGNSIFAIGPRRQ